MKIIIRFIEEIIDILTFFIFQPIGFIIQDWIEIKRETFGKSTIEEYEGFSREK